MKNCIKAIVSSLIIFSMILGPVSAQAYVPQSETEIVNFDDGSYVEIVTTTYPSTRSSEKYAEKVFTYKTFVGVEIVSYTLKGWFEYTSGVSSRATAVDYSYEIYKSGWDIVNHEESRSGNTVYGSAVFSSSSDSKTIQGSMSCDKYGRIS